MTTHQRHTYEKRNRWQFSPGIIYNSYRWFSGINPPRRWVPIACSSGGGHAQPAGIDKRQIPSWSQQDLDFFLHGSMSTEIVPERVLRAFIDTYPVLFPSKDFSHVGLLPDPKFGWPIGFSRAPVAHLGGMQSVEINCATCHVGDVTSDETRVRVLGMTSHFDAEAFFGSLIGATFLAQDPANMKKFLAAYLATDKSSSNDAAKKQFESQWQAQAEKIVAVIKEDPSWANGVESGALHLIQGKELQLDSASLNRADLAGVAHAMLQLFHNMRAALHIPDQPPDKAPPASGPGRNDAFGVLSVMLFGVPQPYAPVKYGLVWNLEKRHWVHCDGNTQSPLGRNLLAALGLGAPLVGKQGKLDFPLVKRQTDLSEHILPPVYPFGIDRAVAARGAVHYQAQCAQCHDGPENDTRLYTTAEIGTQPLRTDLFTQKQADLFNTFLLQAGWRFRATHHRRNRPFAALKSSGRHHWRECGRGRRIFIMVRCARWSSCLPRLRRVRNHFDGDRRNTTGKRWDTRIAEDTCWIPPSQALQMPAMRMWIDLPLYLNGN